MMQPPRLGLAITVEARQNSSACLPSRRPLPTLMRQVWNTPVTSRAKQMGIDTIELVGRRYVEEVIKLRKRTFWYAPTSIFEPN